MNGGDFGWTNLTVQCKHNNVNFNTIKCSLESYDSGNHNYMKMNRVFPCPGIQQFNMTDWAGTWEFLSLLPA